MIGGVSHITLYCAILHKQNWAARQLERYIMGMINMVFVLAEAGRN
jgi:hypothetical protein